MTATWIGQTEATRLKVSKTSLRGVRRGEKSLWGLACPSHMCCSCFSELWETIKLVETLRWYKVL